MPVKLFLVRSLLPLLLLLPWAVPSSGQPATPTPAALAPPQAQALVERALASELRTAQDPTHNCAPPATPHHAPNPAKAHITKPARNLLRQDSGNPG